MARRTTKPPSRVELRRAAEAAEKAESSGKEPSAAKTVKKTVKKTTRKKASKKAESHRLRMVWGVFDNSNQQVAAYPYTDRAAAQQRAQELTEKGRGTYFVQPVKEPIPLEAVAEES